MAEDPPDRLTVSIPSGHQLDLDAVDELVANHDVESRSELIRELMERAQRERAESGELDPSDDV